MRGEIDIAVKKSLNLARGVPVVLAWPVKPKPRTARFHIIIGTSISTRTCTDAINGNYAVKFTGLQKKQVAI